MTADPWFQMVRVTRNNILFRCIKGILRPGISAPEFASVYSGLIPGPITASVPYGLTKWEEDLGSVRGLYLETGLQSLAGPKKGIYEQETGSTKY